MLRSAKDRFTTIIYEGDRYTGCMFGEKSLVITDQKTGRLVLSTDSRGGDSYLWLVNLIDHFEEFRQAILATANWDEDDGANII